MSTTNNGWPRDPVTTRLYIGDDANGAEFATGDVAVVLGQFFTDFHNTIERVYMLNGYRSSDFNASLPGSSPSSNHISGTAGDVNGDRHPNEYANGGKVLWSGFNAAQLAALRVLQAAYLGLVQWGGDYRPGIRDYMHFEVRGTRAQLRALADAIRSVPAPTPPAPPAPPGESDLMPWFFRRNDGAIIIVTPTGARVCTADQWATYGNLGQQRFPAGMDNMDPVPFDLVLSSLGGLVDET